jgi:hypothetical protein
MTSADAAAIAVIVMAPLLVMGRIVVRRSRGEGFTSAELATTLGVLGVAVALVALTRAPGALVTLALPSAIMALGLVVLWMERRNVAMGRPKRFLGFGAVVVGISGLIVAIVRAASAT